MKVTTKLILKFVLVALCFNLHITVKLEVLNTNPSQEYQPDKTPGIIKEMFNKIKKGDGKDTDIYRECLNLLTNNKNSETMRALWDKIKNSQLAPQPGKIERKFFSSFVNSTPEEVLVEGVKKDCSKSVTDCLMELTEIENANKQKELKDIVYPYFNRPNPNVGGKNIVTAFTGVHRDSMEARDLIPKLNGKL
jgi:hypothetical protein